MVHLLGASFDPSLVDLSVDLPEAKRGLLRSGMETGQSRRAGAGRYDQLGIGQGDMLSPLQMAQAVATLASRGSVDRRSGERSCARQWLVGAVR